MPRPITEPWIDKTEPLPDQADAAYGLSCNIRNRLRGLLRRNIDVLSLSEITILREIQQDLMKIEDVLEEARS